MKEEVERPFGRGTVSVEEDQAGFGKKKILRRETEPRLKAEYFAKAKTDNPAFIEKGVQPLYAVMIRYIYRALYTNNWNRTKTARELGISLRTLRLYVSRMAQHGYELKYRERRGMKTVFAEHEKIEMRRILNRERRDASKKD